MLRLRNFFVCLHHTSVLPNPMVFSHHHELKALLSCQPPSRYGTFYLSINGKKLFGVIFKINVDLSIMQCSTRNQRFRPPSPLMLSRQMCPTLWFHLNLVVCRHEPHHVGGGAEQSRGLGTP